MERISIRFGDEISALLSEQAARAGVSRARWVREVVIAELARAGTTGQLLAMDARLRALEARLGLKAAKPSLRLPAGEPPAGSPLKRG